MKVELMNFENKDFAVKASYFKQDNPKGVVVVLPGGGYSHLGACLYYPSNMLMDHGYSVLNIEYDFRFFHLKDQSIESRKEYFDFLFEEINKLDLPENRIALSKSIGTRLLATFDNNFFDKIIWMTPSLSEDYVVDAILDDPKKSCVIIGDADPIYLEYRTKEIESKGVLTLVVRDADHSFDLAGDIDGSLKAIREVTRFVETFISNS